MPNKGCNYCAHYKIGETKMWEPDVPRACELGHTEALNKWWTENGHKTEDYSDMPCFTETSGTTMLRAMTEILDKMLNELQG